MLSRAHNRSRLLTIFLLASVAATCGAKAATITYDFTANPVDFSTSSDIGGSCWCETLQQTLGLINSATGLNSVPAITLNDGDTINGTVRLSDPWTMPASTNLAFFGIGLQSMDNVNVTSVATQDSFSFFDHGVPVAIPAGFDEFSWAGGPSLVLAMGVSTLTPSPSFTFDQIDFSGTMTFAKNGSFQTIGSASLDSANPYLIAMTSPPSPPAAAPEFDPASLGGALTLLVGALAIVRGHRARSTAA